MNDLEFQGCADRVMGMTFSEFGRRIVSNASMGTDHGSSAPLFIFGNMSHGGSRGNAPIITGNEVYRDNIPLQHDFRQVYTSLLSQWLDAGNASIQSATRGNFEQIPVVKNAVVTSIERDEPSTLKLFPNPVRDFATVKLDVLSGKVRIDLIDVRGSNVGMVFEGIVSERQFTKVIDLSMFPPGKYILRVMDGNRRHTLHVIKL
jgi:hypothetical protein